MPTHHVSPMQATTPKPTHSSPALSSYHSHIFPTAYIISPFPQLSNMAIFCWNLMVRSFIATVWNWAVGIGCLCGGSGRTCWWGVAVSRRRSLLRLIGVALYFSMQVSTYSTQTLWYSCPLTATTPLWTDSKHYSGVEFSPSARPLR